jgi:putative oxygen-independent coproporphyrinogen III oxidase
VSASSPLRFVPRARARGVASKPAFTALPPLSLYVHWPWCLAKCPYCDFNSHDAREPVPFERYVDALIADLDAALPQVWGRRVSSVFLGGGTPSLFAPEAVDRLLAAVRARLPLEPGAEVTLEANPGTFERDRFRAYRQAGVTRLSLGVQSFDEGALRALGRVHDAAQAHAAADEARAVFDTFNLDLMYALPMGEGAVQTLEALDRDLDAAMAHEPTHLSVYHLTLEPNTLFATRPPTLPDADAAGEMLDRIVERAQAVGLERYEVSAFARARHRCEHNLGYWHFADYLGLGAGAHGKLSFADRVVRQVRWREPAAYMEHALAGHAVSNEHEVQAHDLPFEFMLNALRLRDGFSLGLFQERCGLPWSMLEPGLEQAVRRGLIERREEGVVPFVRPTALGYDFLSDLQSLFLT